MYIISYDFAKKSRSLLQKFAAAGPVEIMKDKRFTIEDQKPF